MSFGIRGVGFASRALTAHRSYPGASQISNQLLRARFQRPLSCSAACSEPLENSHTHDHPYPLEDTNPAMWQRVIQLIAGSLATGTMVYFVLYADFGEGEHCFMPVSRLKLIQIRRALDIDPEKVRNLFSTGRARENEV